MIIREAFLAIQPVQVNREIVEDLFLPEFRIDSYRKFVVALLEIAGLERKRVNALRERALARKIKGKSKVGQKEYKRVKPCYDTASYRRAIKYAIQKAGLPSWAPNQLRHLYATEIRRKYGLEAAQIMLGHSRADVTQIYAERDEKKMEEIASREG